MPIYELKCSVCGLEDEQVISVNANMPDHCETPMVRQLTTFLSGHNTQGGNLILDNSCGKPKGNRKPRTISNRHGLGGKRKNPTMASVMANRSR